MNEFKTLLERFGRVGLIRLAFYPLTLLVTMPFQLLLALWNARKIFTRSSTRYVHFHPESAINCLFYLTRAENLHRFGRNGRSPYLGLGNYNMGRMFHYSRPSFYLFWKYPAVLVFLGMIAWLSSHFIWVQSTSNWWVAISIAVTAISVLFYSNTFRLQNYNVLGWSFFPIFLYFLYSGDWIFASIAMLFISFGSFTAVVLNCFLLLVLAIQLGSFSPILVAFPGVLMIMTHFIPLLKNSKEGKNVLDSVMKAIGMKSGKSVRYKRKFKGKKFRIADLYYIALYLQFIGVVIWQTGNWPILLITGIVLLVINVRFFRFADEQSIYMLLLSLTIPILIGSPENYFILASFWIAVSPLPALAGYDMDVTVLDRVPAAKPIDLQPMLSEMSNCFEAIPKDSKLFMAFEDPGEVYEHIFSGYRRFIELPAHVASHREIHFLPEWWGVFELNYHGAPEIWGRSPEEVLRNARHWKADYVMIYQDDHQELDPTWETNKFECLSRFEWSKYGYLFNNHKRFDNLSLTFFILKVPSL